MVAILCACGGRDEVVPDGGPDAAVTADGAVTPDGVPMPDARPMVMLGPIESFAEISPGGALANLFPGATATWNGTEFVVASSFAIYWVRPDGTVRDGIVPTLPGAIACHASGECLIASGANDGVRVIRVAADGTELDPAPIFLDTPTDRGALVGATQNGFVVISATALGVNATRFGLSGPPIDATPIELMPGVFATQGNYGDIACDDAGCTVVLRDSLGFDTGPVHVIRFFEDGTVSPVTDIPNWVSVGGVACASARCLVIQQRQTGPGPLEGVFIDPLGAIEGAPFMIAALDDSNFTFDVAADATGFTVIAQHGATATDPHGQVRVIHLDPTGAVEASSDPIPADYDSTWEGASSVACSPSICLAVTSADGIVRRVLIQAGVPLVPQPGYFATADAQLDIRTAAAEDGGHFVSWIDVGVDAEVVTRTIRGAIWSEHAWSIPVTIPLDPDAAWATAAWPGVGYVAISAESGTIGIVRLSQSGALVDTIATTASIPAARYLDHIACLSDGCLVTYQGTGGSFGRFTVDASLAATSLAPTSAAIVGLIPYQTGYAGVSVVDGHVVLQLIAADGTVTSSVDTTPDATRASPRGPLIAPLGDGLVVAWHDDSGESARTISPTLELGPIVPLPIPEDGYLVEVVRSGPGVLFTWAYYWVHRTIYGLQTDATLAPISAPFEIAHVDSNGFAAHTTSSDGTTALCAWTYLDRNPALLTERLAVRSITAD